MSKDPSRTIDLPVKGIFSHAAIGFIEEGFWRGSPALILEVAKEPKPLKPREAGLLVTALLETFGQLSTLHIVRMRGALLESSDVAFLIRTLQKRAFKVQVEISDAEAWPEWLDEASWIVIKTNSPQVSVPFNELWFTPPNGELPMGDASVKMWANREPFFYLTKCLSLEDTLAFVSKSRVPWALL